MAAARCQVGEHLGIRVVCRDQRTGDGRRHERARHGAVAELGEDDGELEDAETLTANGFGQVDALQAWSAAGRQYDVGLSNGVSSAACKTSDGATRATKDRTESARS